MWEGDLVPLMKDKRDPGSLLDLSAPGRAGDRAGPGAFTLLGPLGVVCSDTKFPEATSEP